MNILRVIGGLNPQKGGPATAAILQSREMIKQGHHVSFLTLDDPDEPFLQSVPGDIYAIGNPKNKFGINLQLIPWLRKHGKEYDAVIVHGLWQYLGFATWLASRKIHFKYFVYSHGMLDPWFKKRRLNNFKKWVYWILIEHKVVQDAQGVLFTCEEERRLARGSFKPYKINEIVVEYGVAEPTDDPSITKELFFDHYPHLREKKFLLFLSRIHPKKGCDLLIRAFSQTRLQSQDIHLVIAGPDEIGWESELRELAKKHEVDNYITWTGMLSGDLKWGAYRAASAFILPSHSENFGIAITEALSCGLPVYTTNKVNIWREIKEDGAAIISNDDLQGTNKLIKTWLTMSPQDHNSMKINALLCFQKRFEIKSVVRKTIEILHNELE